MKKISGKYLKSRIAFIVICFFIAVLFAAVVFLMSFVQDLINNDVYYSLEQIVTQNKDVITGKLQIEINDLNNVSNQIESIYNAKYNFQSSKAIELTTDLELAITDYFNYTKDGRSFIGLVSIDNVGTENIRIFTEQGLAVLENGELIDIGGREYFKLAYSGTPNVSERMTSKIHGNDIFVISVPMKINGNIVGTVQRSFTIKEMNELCVISPQYAGRGFMTIVYRNGYIVFTTENAFDNKIREVNFFNELREMSPKNISSVNKMEHEFFLNSDGFIDTVETVVNGKKYFTAYTPVEKIHNWYLVTSVEAEAIIDNSSMVIKIFYAILFSCAFIFSLILLQFLSTRDEQRRRLEMIAYVDPITGGNTFNKFLEYANGVFEREKNSPELFGMLSFDIDNFKYINNYYGFAYGNNVLKSIYQSVSAKLKEGEMLARISGDRFAVLLFNPSIERAKEMIEFQDGQELKLYISAGLYMVTDKLETVNLMMDKAKTAAQKAKGKTHDKVSLYSFADDWANTENEEMKRRVDGALLNSEFIPFYQPKVDVNTGKLVGAEALARWRRADGRLVSPGEFIPLCERTGQIVEIDRMIFEKVLQFFAKRLQVGINCVPISVNFSRLHFLDKNFVHDIIAKIEEYHIPPNLIQVELTESIIFENKNTIIELVNHFHRHGMMICMDDFGSGYSSLNMLKDIDVDVLKIDKGFIDETVNAHRRSTILSSITTMAKNLSMEIVVEGVETEENVLLVKQIGCNIAQGYFYAKPMAEADFDKIFKEGHL